MEDSSNPLCSSEFPGRSTRGAFCRCHAIHQGSGRGLRHVSADNRFLVQRLDSFWPGCWEGLHSETCPPDQIPALSSLLRPWMGPWQCLEQRVTLLSSTYLATGCLPETCAILESVLRHVQTRAQSGGNRCWTAWKKGSMKEPSSLPGRLPLSYPSLLRLLLLGPSL